MAYCKRWGASCLQRERRDSSANSRSAGAHVGIWTLTRRILKEHPILKAASRADHLLNSIEKRACPPMAENSHIRASMISLIINKATCVDIKTAHRLCSWKVVSFYWCVNSVVGPFNSRFRPCIPFPERLYWGHGSSLKEETGLETTEISSFEEFSLEGSCDLTLINESLSRKEPNSWLLNVRVRNHRPSAAQTWYWLYLPEITDGINPRQTLDNGVTDLAKKYRMVLMSGTPACEKSQLLDLIPNELFKRQGLPAHIICGWGRGDGSPCLE